jgi:branched-chain amino acid transport system permease protein
MKDPARTALSKEKPTRLLGKAAALMGWFKTGTLLAIAGVAALAFLPTVLSRVPKGEYYLHILILILMYAYLATAWNILGGFAGQHSLGHSIFLGAGAYASTILFVTWRISPWLGMWAGAVVAALLGWFIGYLCFRYGLRGPYFALVTIALAEALLYLVTNIRALGGARGLEIPWIGNSLAWMQFSSKAGYYYMALGLAVAGIVLSSWLNRRRFGYYLVAVRENEDAAQALGVNLLGMKVRAAVLSAALTAIGGTLYAQYFTYINPRSVFGEMPSVQILLFAIIGGLGTVWGPAVGALVLVPVAEFIRAKLGGSFAGAPLLLYGAILMVVMLFMPKGIVGLADSLRQRLHSKSGEGGGG